MNFIKRITIIFVILLAFTSCYIDNTDNNGTEKTALSFSLPIPEEMMKAPSSGYYFKIYLYPAVGEEIYKEVTLGSYDPYNGGSGGVFPVVITDIPEGTYTDINIEYWLVGNPSVLYIDNSTTEFSITKGENTTINIQIGEFF